MCRRAISPGTTTVEPGLQSLQLQLLSLHTQEHVLCSEKPQQREARSTRIAALRNWRKDATRPSTINTNKRIPGIQDLKQMSDKSPEFRGGRRRKVGRELKEGVSKAAVGQRQQGV